MSRAAFVLLAGLVLGLEARADGPLICGGATPITNKTISPTEVDAITVRADGGVFDTVSVRNITTTASGNAFGVTLADQNKVGTSSAYYFPTSTTLSFVSNGAQVATLERTAGNTLYTPGVGTSGRAPITIFASATAVQNGGTCASGVDLITYSLPASTLVTTNNCIQVTVWGTTANNATSKNIDLSIGSGPTVLVTKALTVSIAGTWNVSATLCRTGSSAQTSWAIAENNGGTTVSSTDGATVFRNTSFSTPNFTETSAQSIRARCITNANAAGDIIAKGMLVTYL